MKSKAHINIVGEEDGLTPLIIASGRGYKDIVFRLLEGGVQVNNSDKFGSTALIWAARKGHLTIVEKLLASGAEIDAVGMQGKFFNTSFFILFSFNCSYACYSWKSFKSC